MDRLEFLNNALSKGKITQEQYNKVIARDKAKSDYKANKSKFLKDDLKALLDIITE